MDTAYKVAADQRFIQARGRCERCGKGLHEWQTHHVQRRLNSGIANHAVANLRTLCPECHAHIHAEVAESKAAGWIVAEWPQIELRDA